eukprot:6313213-Amphidinium_carterae.1
MRCLPVVKRLVALGQASFTFWGCSCQGNEALQELHLCLMCFRFTSSGVVLLCKCERYLKTWMLPDVIIVAMDSAVST